jgi:hypothetical protein
VPQWSSRAAQLRRRPQEPTLKPTLLPAYRTGVPTFDPSAPPSVRTPSFTFFRFVHEHTIVCIVFRKA